MRSVRELREPHPRHEPSSWRLSAGVFRRKLRKRFNEIILTIFSQSGMHEAFSPHDRCDHTVGDFQGISNKERVRAEIITDSLATCLRSSDGRPSEGKYEKLANSCVVVLPSRESYKLPVTDQPDATD